MKTSSILDTYQTWLTHREYSPATIQKYTKALARFFADTGAGDIPTRETVAAWRDSLTEKGYTPATVNAMLAAVNDCQESIDNVAGKALQGRLIELVYFQRKSTAQYAALYALEKGRPRKDLYGAAERICNRKLFAYSNQSVRMNSNRRFCQSIIDCNVIRKRFWNHLWMTCLGYGICKNKNIKNALHLEKIFSILQNRNTILPESIH